MKSMESSKLKSALVVLAGIFLGPLVAMAVQISVPSAPGAGYGLVSTTTGAYIASTTNALVAGTGITFTGGTPYVFGPAVTISSGSSGTVSTSSSETATYVPFWTSTNGTPALLSGGNSTFNFVTGTNLLNFKYASTTAISATGQIFATGGNAVTSVNFPVTSTEQTGLFSNGGSAALATGGVGITWGSLGGVISWYPNTTNVRGLGGTSNQWFQLFTTNASTTNLTIGGITGSTQCLRVDTNGNVSGTGSVCGTGSGTVTSITAGTGLLGGTITTSGTINSVFATSSTLSISGIPYVTNTGATTGTVLFGNVATSSETCTSPLSCTAHDVLTGGGAISLGTVLIANGGTGFTSITDGQLIFGPPSGTALTKLATSTGGVLAESFTTGRPIWQATSTLNIATTDLKGTLNVNQGGTGQTTFTSSQLLYGNGTNALSSVGTTTLAFSGPFNGTSALGALVGGSNSTVTYYGISTSTNGVVSNIPYFTSTSAVGNVATSSIGLGTGLSYSGTLGALVGGAAGTLSLSGVAPSSIALTKGNFLVGDDNGAAQATSTIFITSVGNVGIGTQTPTLVNANGHLTVAGISSQDIIASTTDNTTLSDAILQAYAPGSRVFLGAHGTNQVTSRYGITLGGWGEIGAFNSSFGTTNGLIVGTNPAVPLVFGTNNVERARFVSSGALGIGTTSPWAALAVSTSSQSAGNLPLFDVGSTTGADLFNVMGNGNVGIATTSPGSLFSIGNTAGINFTIGTTTFKTTGGINIAGGGCLAVNGVCVGGSGVTSITQNGGGTAQTGAIIFATSTDSFNGLQVSETITNSGATFTFANNVTGTLTVPGGGTGATTLTGLLQGNGASAITGVTGTAGQFPYYNGASTLIATSTIFLGTNGQLGIGTTTPQRQLDLAGPGNIRDQQLIEDTNGTTNAHYIGFNSVNGALNIDQANDAIATTTIANFATSTVSWLNILSGGQASIGTTTPYAALGVLTSSATQVPFALSTTTGSDIFRVDAFGHVSVPGPSPTLSSCGTTPTVVGSDSAFEITVGSVAATGCTATFAHAFSVAPVCTVTNQTVSVANAMTYTVSASAVVISQTGLTSDKVDVICTGRI